MRLTLSDDFTIDSTQEPYSREGIRIVILGGSGSGKSWVGAKYAEDFLSQGGSVVIFQPTDEYYTLKEKFEVICVGGVHAKDIDFIPKMPSLYAKSVVENGVNLVFYTSEVEEEKLIDFVQRFIDQLMKLQEVHKRPVLLVIEEAQKYAPLKASGHIAPSWVYGRMIGAFSDVFERGRKLNVSAIAISPRPQGLNMAIRQLANVTLLGKFGRKDVSYLKKEIEIYKEKGDIDVTRLANLKAGEWLTITNKPRFIEVTEKRITRHGAETPKLEYLAPVKEETKQAVNSLLSDLQEALKKEGEEESELQKEKRKSADLEKRLKEAEDKVRLAGNIRELLAGSPKEVGEKVAELEREKEVLQNKVEFFETEGKKADEEIQRLRQELEGYKIVENWLTLIIIRAYNNELQPRILQLIRDNVPRPKPQVIVRETGTAIVGTARPPAMYRDWLERLPRKGSEILQYCLDQHPREIPLSEIAVRHNMKTESLKKNWLPKLRQVPGFNVNGGKVVLNPP